MLRMVLLPRHAGRNRWSEAAARHETAIRLAVVDIFKRRGDTNRGAARQARQRVFESMRAGPAHVPEERRHTRRATRTDQPESAIRRRPEDDIVMPEKP